MWFKEKDSDLNLTPHSKLNLKWITKLTVYTCFYNAFVKCGKDYGKSTNGQRKHSKSNFCKLKTSVFQKTLLRNKGKGKLETGKYMVSANTWQMACI